MKFPLLSAWAIFALAGSLPTASHASDGTLTSSGPSNVTSVRFCPRTGFAPRMLGGQFQGSFNKITWSVIASISTVPVENHWSSLTIDSHRNRMAFRYLRYMPPAGSYGNIAELEFDGGMNRTKLNGIAFGVPGSYGNGGDDFSKAFDGNLDTFYDSVKPSGGFVGIDLSVMRVPSPPQPPVRMLPAVPVGLTATSQFTMNCAKTGGIAMPHIALSWKSETGASYYTVYRNGAAVQVGVIPCAWTDMDITSGQTYSYALTATGPGGESSRCAPISVTAPAPQVSTPLTPPANVGIVGLWLGATANTLHWPSVPGASTYNVYVSDVLVGTGIKTTTYTLTPDKTSRGALYTVTSVNANGLESIPSAPTGFITEEDPTNVPTWAFWTPIAPDLLKAVSDWNQGSPRILLQWRGNGNASTVFSIYRDGQKVASGLWRPYYIDTGVAPGSTHSYCVSTTNTDAPLGIEGSQSASCAATALDSPPASISGKVTITKIVPNDDSAVVFFAPVAGATDYRIYDIADPSRVKYAGEITKAITQYLYASRTPICIEWNGIDPSRGANLIVEAVDKFGPFQRMEGAAGSGAMNMDGSVGTALNGQGDPSNVPVTLAKSDPFHVGCVPVTLTGDQVFFDNFRTESPLVRLENPAPYPNAPYYGQTYDYAAYANDKWQIRQYGADLANSRLFFMDSHFMDTTFDGGGPGSPNGPHNNDASMVMVPKATTDISGGKVLHVTFEVDAHMDPRRWCSLLIGEAGDELVDPAKFDDFNVKPTVSGRVLRWEIQRYTHSLRLFEGDGNMKGVDLMQFGSAADATTDSRVAFDYVGPLANGTKQDLDKRHRFDLYLSSTHYRIMETTPDGLYNIVRDKDFPAGLSLPFSKCQAYFVHQVYHTTNDRAELMTGYPEDNTHESYWFNYRPYSDERHWDNMGQEVLSDFPK